MMTCQACGREFKSTRYSKYCPNCGFNNGRGWWPRLECAPPPDKRRYRRKRPKAKREQEPRTEQHCETANDRRPARSA